MADYGSLDLMAIPAFIDWLRTNKERKAAGKYFSRNPTYGDSSFVGPQQSPPGDLFSNPFFLQALRERAGVAGTEAATRATDVGTAAVRQRTGQEAQAFEGLGRMTPEAFGQVTARRGQEEGARQFQQMFPLHERQTRTGEIGAETARSGLEESTRQFERLFPLREREAEAGEREAGVRERMASTAEAGVRGEAERNALLKSQIESAERLGLLENLPMLIPAIGAGALPDILSQMSGGAFEALRTGLSNRKARQAEELKGYLPTDEAPGRRTIRPGEVFRNPAVQRAYEASGVGRRTAPALPGGLPGGLSGGLLPPAQPATVPAETVGDITAALRATQQNLLRLLQQPVPQTRAEEATYRRSTAGLPQTQSDFTSLLEAARALGVQNLQDFEALMVELGKRKGQ